MHKRVSERIAFVEAFSQKTASLCSRRASHRFFGKFSRFQKLAIRQDGMLFFNRSLPKPLSERFVSTEPPTVGALKMLETLKHLANGPPVSTKRLLCDRPFRLDETIFVPFSIKKYRKRCHSAAEGGPSAHPLNFDHFSFWGLPFRLRGRSIFALSQLTSVTLEHTKSAESGICLEREAEPCGSEI